MSLQRHWWCSAGDHWSDTAITRDGNTTHCPQHPPANTPIGRLLAGQPVIAEITDLQDPDNPDESDPDGTR